MSEANNEPGTAAWQAIEPVWDLINIYDGPDIFLGQFRSVAPATGHLFACHWCHSEVCNGGFHQFFWNSTGVLAPEAAEGFTVLGLTDCAALVKEAMAYFGSPYPRERSERIAQLEQLTSGTVSDVELFLELDDRFFAAIGEFSERFYRVAD